MAVTHPQEPLDALGVAARQLQVAVTRDDLLQHVVDAAGAAIGGCTYAGVSTDRDGRPNSPIVSDPAVLAIDSLQYVAGRWIAGHWIPSATRVLAASAAGLDAHP
jgi:hypothetical protein